MRHLYIITVISVFLVPVFVVRAETHVSGDIVGEASWDAAHSPYILDDTATVLDGSVLTVGPGVVITADPVSGVSPELSVQGGSLIMNGTQDSPISVGAISDISVSGGTTTMKHVEYAAVDPLYLNESHADISYSSFRGAWRAMSIRSGLTRISSSTIEGNGYGIYMDNYVPVLMKADKPSLLSRLFVALSDMIMSRASAQADPAVHPIESGVIVRSSSFPKTSAIAVSNLSPRPGAVFDAVGDWWGSADGPSSPAFGSSRIIGSVDYSPWLDHEPDLTEKGEAVCCSSILFIPGLEGTRLFRTEENALGLGMPWLIGSTTKTLWEPSANDAVRALFLDEEGSSTDSRIYSGAPIDSAWGFGIYGSFMKFLDGLVTQGKASSWYGFGYDWRKSVPDVVLGDERKATSSDSLIERVYDLAARSKTGKVTIIAHSNGGLVAKYLVRALALRGDSDLIDSVISVAVPYLGTPEAIGGVLHGDDEALAGGLLLKSSVARELGLNMSSAYSLLPSATYYSAVPGATVSFASTAPMAFNDGSYPRAISSFDDMSSFIVDAKNARIHASTSDIVHPIQGNPLLMGRAGDLHSLLDGFSWPANIAPFSIVGWDALTTTGITYGTKEHCGISSYAWTCEEAPSHTENKSNMGDGTVVARSAADPESTVVSIDLATIDTGAMSHADILESKTAQSVIEAILAKRPISQGQGVSLGAPDPGKERSYIAISTHSPVQLHVYDAHGRHVGEVEPPSGAGSLYRAYETDIPGSSFDMTENSDADVDTYVYVPDDGQRYSVALKGTGFGGFTYDVDRFAGGAMVDHAEYAGLPATPLAIATTSLRLLPYAASSPSEHEAFASSLEPLAIDWNGDGKTDMAAAHDASTTITTSSYLDILKGTCDALKSYQCKGLSKRIDALADKIKKGKMKHTAGEAPLSEARIGHRDERRLSDVDAKEIWNAIDRMIKRFEGD